MKRYAIDTFFTAPSTLVMNSARRGVSSAGDISWITDTFRDSRCAFIRSYSAAEISLSGPHRLKRCASGGWLIQPIQSPAPIYWLPCLPATRHVDEYQRHLAERSAEILAFEADADGLRISLAPPENGWCIEVVIWRIEDALLSRELEKLSHIETQGYFLLGSHGRYGKPADLYARIMNGVVYDPRFTWPRKRRICSENEAHALYLVFAGLARATGKRIYAIFQAQLLLAVLARQGTDGGYRHGEWTHEMEAHFRLNASAMHLMLDAFSEAPDPVVVEALHRLAKFLAQHVDPLTEGVWFLHDELECSDHTMQGAPFPWKASRALGKSTSNMLVLNTHLDTSIALDRYGSMLGRTDYAQLVEAANLATQRVLGARPAERFYRWVFSALTLTQLPTPIASQLPWWKRAWKRLGWRYLGPQLYRAKARHMRLVMPGGYIDRAGPLQGFAFHYLTVNLMDLVRHRARFNLPITTEVIRNGQEFIVRTQACERWAEFRYERYAIGFWAECLVLLCHQDDSNETRNLLAEALVLLERLKMGLPPSALGANAEAVAPSNQFSMQFELPSSVRVANLSRGNTIELLLVNVGDASVRIENVPADFVSLNGDGMRVSEPCTLQTRAWILWRKER